MTELNTGDETGDPRARWWSRHAVAFRLLIVLTVVAILTVLLYIAAWHAAQGLNDIS